MIALVVAIGAFFGVTKLMSSGKKAVAPKIDAAAEVVLPPQEQDAQEVVPTVVDAAAEPQGADGAMALEVDAGAVQVMDAAVAAQTVDAAVKPTTVDAAAAVTAGKADAAVAAVSVDTINPALPKATVAKKPGASIAVKAQMAGELSFVIANGATVKVKDELARFIGAEATAKKINDLGRELGALAANVAREEKAKAAAVKKKDAAAVKAKEEAILALTKGMTEKKAEQSRLQLEIGKWTVSAPSVGTVKVATSKGKTVKIGDVIASVEASSTLGVAFSLPIPGHAFGVGLEVPLIVSGTGRRVSCVVTKLDAGGVSMSCPDLTEGTTVGFPQ
jgi:hypothetical protein